MVKPSRLTTRKPLSCGRLLATKSLLVQLNNSSDPAEIRDLLSQITGSKIDESVAVFTPLYINYGKNTKIGKNVFINFDCVFLDLGGITVEDNVLIAPKVSLLSEGHPVDPSDRQSLKLNLRHNFAEFAIALKLHSDNSKLERKIFSARKSSKVF